jgi:hypothetical protein
MAAPRHPSDGSVWSNSPSAKEANTSAFDAGIADTSPRPSTAPVTIPLVLSEANSLEHTAYKFSNKKKWAVLTVVALCQTSMSRYQFNPSQPQMSVTDIERLQRGRILQCYRPSQQGVQPRRQPLHKCQSRHGVVLDLVRYWL